MKERLIEFLAYLGMGQTKFEEKVGLSRGFVNTLKNNLTIKTLGKIESACPELNTEWLKTGKGEMIKNVVTQNNVEGDNIQGHNVTVKKTETEKFLDLLKTKDEQLGKSQSQIDRLIGIIEKKLNK
jgi:transcriptional regulator with XRE-family HTH domain